jgi:hypothetical protein
VEERLKDEDLIWQSELEGAGQLQPADCCHAEL